MLDIIHQESKRSTGSEVKFYFVLALWKVIVFYRNHQSDQQSYFLQGQHQEIDYSDIPDA